jgi:predicted phosphodiesterase
MPELNKDAQAVRKIAVFADVHGNYTALRAVLADAHRHHASDFWFLGDVLLPGPGSHEILEVLGQLGITSWPRGNWEDLLVGGHQKILDVTDPQRLYFTRQVMYQDQFLDEATYAKLAQLPLTVTHEVGGLTFRLSHNLPFKNYGQELIPTESQANFDQLLEPGVDVALYGHTHRQLVRYGSGGQLIVNPGTVGMAFANPGKVQHDLRAMYALLTVSDARISSVDLRKVEYDKNAELALAKRRGLPYYDLYQDQLLAGVGYTHNRPVLAAYAAAHGYLQEVDAYVNK